MTHHEIEERTALDYARVLRRHKLAVALPLASALLAAVLLSFNQQTLSQASTEVLLGDPNLAASLSGALNVSEASPPDRVAETQARLARVPAVADRVIKAMGLRGQLSVKDFLSASDVSAETNADLLEFRVRDPDPALAMKLATSYARQFTLYRKELDSASIQRAIKEIHDQLEQIEAAGDRGSVLHTNLVTRGQQLETLKALQGSSASLVRPATEAVQVQPRPLRTGLIGAAVGLLLGVALAFVLDALDTRARSPAEIGDRIRLPVLGRVSDPPRGIRKSKQLALLVRPEGVEADMFRVLRTNLEFANVERNARLVMVTSAVEGEGKSTVAANLAVSLARAGRRVLLVDLDLRRPVVGDFFGLQGAGFTDVVLARVPLDKAIARVKLSPSESQNSPPGANGGGGFLDELLTLLPPGQITPNRNALKVLTAGRIPPPAVEFMTLPRVDYTLQALREYASIILIDAPPLLGGGDGIALSAKVDGLLAVIRANAATNETLDEFHAALESSPAAKLGLVLVGSERRQAEYYGRRKRSPLFSYVSAIGASEMRKRQ
jgi:succinoglycan biosynthesis transport protein ExoP